MDTGKNCNKVLLIIVLDRLIKKVFLDKVIELTEKKKIGERKLIKIKADIAKHNDQLLKNLFLDKATASKANRSLQCITRLYGFKKYHPSLLSEAGEGKGRFSLQRFINEYVQENCSGKENLSEYFYTILNKAVIESNGIQTFTLQKIIRDRLNLLFDLVFPKDNITTWEEFARQEKVISLIESFQQQLKTPAADKKSEIKFKVLYYSQSKKRIHSFSLLISKEVDVLEKESRSARIIFDIDGYEYEGKFTRKQEQILLRSSLTKPTDSTKRSILLALIERTIALEEVNIFQGVYMGDSIRQAGYTFSYEFIAGKESFLADVDNYARIVSSLLLKRSSFRIPNIDSKSLKLEKKFSHYNLLDDELKNIVVSIREQAMVFLNYGRSGNIFLSKMTFDEHYAITLTSIISNNSGEKRTTELVTQTCNISGRNKNKRIIATTYKEGHLKNIVTVDFKKPSSKVFNGAFVYHGDEGIYTSYIVAVISERNKDLQAEELSQEKIEHLRKSKIFDRAFHLLATMRNG